MYMQLGCNQASIFKREQQLQAQRVSCLIHYLRCSSPAARTPSPSGSSGMASSRAWRSYQTRSGRCAVHRHAPWLVLWLASGALGLPWLPCIWQCMHAFLLAPQPVPSIVQALALDGGVWELAACPCNHVCYSYSMPTLLVFVPRRWQRTARCGSWLPARALELTLNRFLFPVCRRWHWTARCGSWLPS